MAEAVSVLIAELVVTQAPCPIALRATREVHAGIRVQTENVLNGDDRQVRDGCEGESDEVPGDVLAGYPQVLGGVCTLGRGRGAKPAERRIVVVRSGVDDAVRVEIVG